MPPSYKVLASLFILLTFIVIIIWTYITSPPIPLHHRNKIRFPKDIIDVQEIGMVLSEYKDEYFFHVLYMFCLCYIFFQTFCIPGTLLLCFLAGSLFGLIPGLFLVALLSAIGASGAYFMSSLIGKRIVRYFAPEKLRRFGEEVEKHRNNLWSYFIFVRVSPLFPNWFVNLASPIFSIPFHIFFIGTFIGVLPQCFIAVKSGLTLQDIKSINDILDVKSFLSLFFIAFLALIPSTKPFQEIMARILTKKSSIKDKEE